MKNNKKGISAVVATVLIILITVAAVTIIWAAIIPMINNQLASGTVCLDAMTQISLENKGYTCYNDSASMVFLQVKHGSKDIGLQGFQVLVSEAGATNSTNNMSIPGINEEKVISVAHISTTANGPETVTVAPIVQVGNAEETCDAVGTITLTAC